MAAGEATNQVTRSHVGVESKEGKMKKIWNETTALAWTLGGTGLVLITLSGQTRTYGLWITGASLALHFAGVFFKGGDE